MWPPNRDDTARGRSRLTGLSPVRNPRLVRRKVSGTISTWKLPPSMETTVRQAPLTAMLSPNLMSPGTSSAATVNLVMFLVASDFSRAATRPTSSTIPVNISLCYSPAWPAWYGYPVIRTSSPRVSTLVRLSRNTWEMSSAPRPPTGEGAEEPPIIDGAM